MLASSSLFLIGLGFLLGGAECLVRGAAAIARGLGVPPVVIGLTVVAFGTGTPELFVAIVGTSSGAGGVAFGNVVGATVTNSSFILGIAAVMRPLSIHRSIVSRELPMLLLASCAALVVSIDGMLDATANLVDRSDGLILCLFFTVFIYYTAITLLQTGRDRFVVQTQRAAWRLRFKAASIPIGLVLIGLVGLALGGHLVVNEAASIAERLGLTQAAVGLTIVSLGTTAPELVISILAVRRGETDLAVGNVVGSNIFNLLLALGLAATLSPITVPMRGPFALSLAVALTLVLLIFSGYRKRLDRPQGLLLLSIFVVYYLWIAFP